MINEFSRNKKAQRKRNEINENFSRDDLPEISQVFGKINRDNALPGERIQEEDGTWIIK